MKGYDKVYKRFLVGHTKYTVYKKDAMILAEPDKLVCSSPCGCGRQFDWCAGWPGVPWSAAAHLQGSAWTGVEWPTPVLQPYFSPTQLTHAVK